MRHGVDSNTFLNIELKAGFYETHSVAVMLPPNKKKLRGKDEKKIDFIIEYYRKYNKIVL